MSRSLMLVAPLAMFALATSALAGGPDCEKNANNAAYAASKKGGCSASKEDCAKYMTEANAPRLKAAWKPLMPGSTVDYTVKRDGVTKDITATLGKMPDDVYQAMVDGHMKEHVAVAAK